jgi:hypothetical protein
MPPGQRQPDDGQQLDGDQGEQDAQHHRAGNAPEDHPCRAGTARPAMQAKADHDGIVARQHDVDDDDL